MNNSHAKVRERHYLDVIKTRLENPKTSYEKIRLGNAIRYLKNPSDDGRFGKAQELLSASSSSKKTDVSKQGIKDIHIKIDTGKTRYAIIGAEVKQNGGRIGSLLEMLENGHDQPFIYSIDLNNSATNWNHRYVKQKITMLSVFVDFCKNSGYKIIRDIKADDDYGIQASSKHLYEHWQNFGLDYDSEKVYTYEELYQPIG